MFFLVECLGWLMHS